LLFRIDRMILSPFCCNMNFGAGLTPPFKETAYYDVYIGICWNRGSLSDRRLLCNMHNSNRHRSTKVQIICSLWLTWRDYILLGFGIKGRCLLFLLFGICFGFLSFVLCTVWFICLYSASCCCAFSSFLI